MDASHAPPAGDLTHNPGMCPDWESNWRLFGLQAGTQSTELHQPGHLSAFFPSAAQSPSWVLGNLINETGVSVCPTSPLPPPGAAYFHKHVAHSDFLCCHGHFACFLLGGLSCGLLLFLTSVCREGSSGLTYKLHTCVPGSNGLFSRWLRAAPPG